MVTKDKYTCVLRISDVGSEERKGENNEKYN